MSNAISSNLSRVVNITCEKAVGRIVPVSILYVQIWRIQFQPLHECIPCFFVLLRTKKKKKKEDMINKRSSVQSRTRLGIASSDLKRHEGSSFTVVSLWPVRLQAYASISINQSIPGCANFQMAEAPIWIQCGIGRVQHDCLIKSNRERTPKNQTGHIDFVNTYHSMILFE